MHTGMLWFDNSNVAPLEKISRGIEYYLKKYGRSPDTVFVHPSYVKKTDTHEAVASGHHTVTVKQGTGHVTVEFYLREYRPVLPGHIWIGIEDKVKA